MGEILIANARMVNEGHILEGDLLVRNGRIEQIGGQARTGEKTKVLDARGKLLIPGMIDDQVHFREPGATHKGDIQSESRAAVAGGVTSFMDMPNTNPNTVSLDALEMKFERASGRAMANYSFYLGGANDNIEAIRALDKNQACGIKVFMGASTGNMLVDQTSALEAIFREAPGLVAVHCEDSPTIQENEAIYREKYGDAVPMEFHPAIRSEEACYRSSSFAVALARECGTRLHVLHLSTAKEMQLFDSGPLDKKQITAEVCVHHLLFDSADYINKGAFIKCNPAIKSEEDKIALRRALMDDRIDVVGTDHAPHTLDEKLRDYFQAPAGLPLVQHALPMLLELYHDHAMTLKQVVEKACHAPARLFQIVDRGYLREGYWADLVLIDLDTAYRVERNELLYRCGWSPMEGKRLRSQVVATFVNGHLVYDDGQVNEQARGMRLDFSR